MLEALKETGRLLKREFKALKLAMKDERTPPVAKALLWMALGYTLLPFDLIPDFIPVLGHLDDAVIVPALVIIALKMIPEEVMRECREKAGSS